MKYFIFICIFSCAVQLAWTQEDEYFVGLIQKGDGRVNAIDVNLDNSLLLMGAENKMVSVYDLNSKKKIFETEAHYQPIVQVKFSREENTFYTIGDRSIKIWKTGIEKPEKIYTGTVTNITSWDCTPDEDFFVGSSYSKKYRYWDHSELKAINTVETDHKKNIISIALSNNNKWVATGSLDTSIEIREIDSNTKKHLLLAHSRPVSCLEFVNDDRHLISASHDGNGRLWDVESGQAVQMYTGQRLPISAISVSPDGKFLLMASYDHTIALFNIATGERIHVYAYHESPVLDVVWKSLGDGFYSCDKEGNIVEWSVPKKVFVDFYYGDDIETELVESKLLLPRKKGEAKDDFKARQAKAEKLNNQLQDKYFQEYMELQKTFVIGQ